MVIGAIINGQTKLTGSMCIESVNLIESVIIPG